jgi:hypothetical protein
MLRLATVPEWWVSMAQRVAVGYGVGDLNRPGYDLIIYDPQFSEIFRSDTNA